MISNAELRSRWATRTNFFNLRLDWASLALALGCDGSPVEEISEIFWAGRIC